MTKIFIIFIACVCVLWAGEPVKHVGEAHTASSTYAPSIGIWARDWGANRQVYVWNSSSDSVKTGETVIWDNVAVLVDSQRYNGTDTINIQDSLKTTRWWNLYGEVVGTAANCTLFVAGKDTSNTTQADTIVITGENDKTYSAKYWRKVSLAYFHQATEDTIRIKAIPYMTVIQTTTSASALIAGVVAARALPDSLTKLIIQGYYQAYVKGATTEVTPGAYIETSSTSGYGTVNTTPAAGKGLGTALESGNTDKRYWVFINTAY